MSQYIVGKDSRDVSMSPSFRNPELQAHITPIPSIFSSNLFYTFCDATVEHNTCRQKYFFCRRVDYKGSVLLLGTSNESK